MTSECPRVKADALFSPTETARLLGICKDTLRKYERFGFISSMYRPCSGRKGKVYSGREIRQCFNSATAIGGRLK